MRCCELNPVGNYIAVKLHTKLMLTDCQTTYPEQISLNFNIRCKPESCCQRPSSSHRNDPGGSGLAGPRDGGEAGEQLEDA
jgi:hypothetical protein